MGKIKLHRTKESNMTLSLLLLIILTQSHSKTLQCQKFCNYSIYILQIFFWYCQLSQKIYLNKLFLCCLLKASALCEGVISKSFKMELTKKLKDKPFLILIDETTDLSTNKLLAIVVRHYDDDSEQVLDDLLGLVEVASATADSLFAAVSGK